MSNPAFGTKFTCEGCGERFYDLNRLPSTCFKCGVVQSPPKPRMSRPVRGAPGGGGFGRRPLPIAAEEKLEPADALAADDAGDDEIPDGDDVDNDLDDDEAVEIEVEIDPDDGKVMS